MKKFDTEYKVLKVEETTYRNGKPATQVTILCPECEKEEIVTDSKCLSPKHDQSCWKCKMSIHEQRRITRGIGYSS